MAKQKEAWDKLSMLEKALLIKLSVDNGVSSLKLIRDTYNLYADGGQEEILNKVNSSNANFVQRLKDPNRKNIPDWESPTDRISTHKLSVGTDENGNHYIFPEVQEINGELIDFTRPPYHRFAGEISAEMRGDTVRVPSIEDGIKFTLTYKQYYPFNNGGNLVHKFDGNSDTQYLRTLQPEVIMPVTGKTADTSWYEWWFANRQKQLQQNIETVKKNDRERDFTKYFITYPNAEEDTKRMIEALGKTKEYVGNAGMMEDPIGNSLARKVLASDIADYTPDISDDDVNSFLSYLQNGVHLPAYNSILYPGRWESPSKTTVTHERAHAADAFFPRKAINYFTTAGEVNPELYDTWYKRIFASLHPKHPLGIYPSSGRSNSYLDAPNEVYSRLMEFRQFVGANPNYTWTKDDLKKYEPALNKFELRRYSDDDILKLLNEIAQNNSGFQKSENTHLAAFGGPLSHKKSTGGPLYPFSFEKNPFLKTPVVRYDEGGFFAKLFGKKDTPPTPEEIKADRVERFINDTWETEYSVPRGYDPTTGLFYPYKSPEGGTKTIGPGFKLRADGSGDATMFSAKEAAKGVTREQINEKLRAQGELQYDKVLEFLNQKGNRLPIDTINPNIMNGLMDLRFLVGALGGWDNLREAVLDGDLESIKKESLVTFKDGDTGKIKPDVRRNELRAKKFWHYD